MLGRLGPTSAAAAVAGKNWFRSSPRLKIFSNPHLDKIRSALTVYEQHSLEKIIAKRGSKHCISLLAQKITNRWWWWCWQSWQIWWLTTLTCKFSKKVSSTFMLCITSEVAIAWDGNYWEKYLNFSTSNYMIWEKM